MVLQRRPRGGVVISGQRGLKRRMEIDKSSESSGNLRRDREVAMARTRVKPEGRRPTIIASHAQC
jgi:hypothetical protein